MFGVEAAMFGAAPDALRLVNPIAADLDQLRPTPVATLALAAQRNAARGYSDCALFEIGPAFTGARAMTATSGPGQALMTEAIGLAAVLEIPIVVIECARAGPSTGAGPSFSSGGDLEEFGTVGDIPVVGCRVPERTR